MTEQLPGYRGQDDARNAFRAGGVAVFGIGLVLTVIAFADFFIAFGGSGPPTLFFLAFIGIPLMGVGGWLLLAGFGGAAAKYAAGELAPTAKNAIGSLGLGGAGQTCPQCGSSVTATAKFCDECGSALSRTCPSCGNANAADARFCTECGRAVT
jgi:hypothetical protein